MSCLGGPRRALVRFARSTSMADAKRSHCQELLIVAVFLQVPLEAPVSATRKKLQRAGGPPERFAEAAELAEDALGQPESPRKAREMVSRGGIEPPTP